jgi:hypothetical protein
MRPSEVVNLKKDAILLHAYRSRAGIFAGTGRRPQKQHGISAGVSSRLRSSRQALRRTVDVKLETFPFLKRRPRRCRQPYRMGRCQRLTPRRLPDGYAASAKGQRDAFERYQDSVLSPAVFPRLPCSRDDKLLVPWRDTPVHDRSAFENETISANAVGTLNTGSGQPNPVGNDRNTVG